MKKLGGILLLCVFAVGVNILLPALSSAFSPPEPYPVPDLTGGYFQDTEASLAVSQQFFPTNTYPPCTVTATLDVNSMKGTFFNAALTITVGGISCPIDIAPIYKDVYGTFVKATEIHFAGPDLVGVATVTPISGSLYGISGIFKGTDQGKPFICKFRLIETPPQQEQPSEPEEPSIPGPAPTPEPSPDPRPTPVQPSPGPEPVEPAPISPSFPGSS